MAAITITNTDWSVVEDVRNALAAATTDGAPVFASVAVATAGGEVADKQLVRSPLAVVRYLTTREDASPEDVRGCNVELELTVAALVDDGSADEASRLAEVLRLKNAAVNAVEADPPADAKAWGDGNHYHRRLTWGPPEVDASIGPPWAACRLNASVGIVLDSPTSH